jgi:hypothetical protein
MKMLISTLAALLMISSSAFAHAGHDKTPGALAAPHGGMVQGTSELYIEILTDQNDVKLYPLDHESKPISVQDIKLSATATMPRKGKVEKVAFTTEGDHFKTTVDAKGAHRYELNIEVDYKGKKEKVKFTVEPQ